MLHKHKCGNPYCSLIWEHDAPDTTGMEAVKATKFYEAGHMCPRCHTGPYYERHFENSQEREKFARDHLAELLAPFLRLFEDEDDDSNTDTREGIFHL